MFCTPFLGTEIVVPHHLRRQVLFHVFPLNGGSVMHTGWTWNDIRLRYTVNWPKNNLHKHIRKNLLCQHLLSDGAYLATVPIIASLSLQCGSLKNVWKNYFLWSSCTRWVFGFMFGIFIHDRFMFLLKLKN